MSLRSCLLLVLIVIYPAWADPGWEIYKARFLMPDGRIIDTGNGNISHSEGQGFAMLLAAAHNDRPTFDKLWRWTDGVLRNKQNGLFYWRYDPTAADPIADKNNASDGDALIAWALLRGQQQWHDNAYGAASDAISNALLKRSALDFAGYRLMLPGAKGFTFNDRVNLNPSYFIFPAWQAFADRSRLAGWRDLLRDGYKLVGKMGWGEANLPTDWVALAADGRLTPAREWPPRTSYDAIRIALYLYWQDPQSPQLAPWRKWWRGFARGQTPAWVDVSDNQTAPYMMNGGLLAVRDLTMGEATGEPQITAQDDYYSASLKMLVALARQSR